MIAEQPLTFQGQPLDLAPHSFGELCISVDALRLSTDTRYQLASEPVDERWIGENPIAHGLDAKKGMIC